MCFLLHFDNCEVSAAAVCASISHVSIQMSGGGERGRRRQQQVEISASPAEL